MTLEKSLSILGTRGVPANHGGFETFAEHFSLYLIKKGWEVTVYCQADGRGDIYCDYWKGIRRVHIPIGLEGAKGTIVFDWKSTCHAARNSRQILTLGYNTAIFCAMYRCKKNKNIINMDGIEWQREKWSFIQRTWLYFNERMGALLGNHLVADHPEIKNHLTKFVASEKVTVIPYAAELLISANEKKLNYFQLKPGRFGLLIARPEPENSILEIIRSFSDKRRGLPLVVLGNYDFKNNSYHKKVLDAANEEICFVGAVYEPEVVKALRFYARFYVHGHTVGGTNPSLVEALGASSPILAHDNKFNQWVAGKNALFFSSEQECGKHIQRMIEDDKLIAEMKISSRKQYKKLFTEEQVYGAYENILKEIYC